MREYEPTHVANFAFLTRERVAHEGYDTFVRTNRSLLGRFVSASSLPSVRAVLTVSSGAALDSTASSIQRNPYGYLKRIEEAAALSLVGSARSVVVARAWSVSGPYVRRPRAYAFSDFILSARAAKSGSMRTGRCSAAMWTSGTFFPSVCNFSTWSGRVWSIVVGNWSRWLPLPRQWRM